MGRDGGRRETVSVSNVACLNRGVCGWRLGNLGEREFEARREGKGGEARPSEKGGRGGGREEEGGSELCGRYSQGAGMDGAMGD